ncbi:MAG: carbonic anhydrase, partial [Cyclobacteriaceae bacterium]
MGCRDSRVAPRIILNRDLGDVWKHQKPGPLVLKVDPGSISSLYHPMANLHVRHIVVCCHIHYDYVGIARMDDLPEAMSCW